MISKGYVADMASAFDRYLGAGRPAYEPRLRLEAHEAIDLARASGAVPVIAHPHTIGVSADDYASAFSDLAAVGLGGIEAYYAEYSLEMRLHLARIADRLGLVATGGSDYHGVYKPGLRIGTGFGDLVVPDAALQNLEAARSDPSSDRPPRR
jgi:predicted metal-dependent phosphoesterase TrpH